MTRKPEMRREFSINDQLIRAALSISNNIAEGFEYDNRKDFIKYLRYSKGSTGEVRNILTFLLNINLIDHEYFDSTCEELKFLSRQIYTLINYLTNSSRSK